MHLVHLVQAPILPLSGEYSRFNYELGAFVIRTRYTRDSIRTRNRRTRCTVRTPIPRLMVPKNGIQPYAPGGTVVTSVRNGGAEQQQQGRVNYEAQTGAITQVEGRTDNHVSDAL